MLVGIDWGGAKIEGVEMGRDGAKLVRLREGAPRHAVIRAAGLTPTTSSLTMDCTSAIVSLPGALKFTAPLRKSSSAIETTTGRLP